MTDLGCLGLIQSRFQLFWHDSMIVSAFFDCFNHRSIQSDSSRIGPVWRELAQIDMNQSWVGTNPKKKNQTWHWHAGSDVNGRTLRRAVSNSGAAPSQPRQCFLGSYTYYLASQNDCLLVKVSFSALVFYWILEWAYIWITLFPS